MHHQIPGSIHAMIVFIDRQFPHLTAFPGIPLVTLIFRRSTEREFLLLKDRVNVYQAITQVVYPRLTAPVTTQPLLHCLNTCADSFTGRGCSHAGMTTKGHAVLSIMIADDCYWPGIARRYLHNLPRQVLNDLASNVNLPVAIQITIMALCPGLPAERVTEA